MPVDCPLLPLSMPVHKQVPYDLLPAPATPAFSGPFSMPESRAAYSAARSSARVPARSSEKPERSASSHEVRILLHPGSDAHQKGLGLCQGGDKDGMRKKLK